MLTKKYKENPFLMASILATADLLKQLLLTNTIIKYSVEVKSNCALFKIIIFKLNILV